MQNNVLVLLSINSKSFGIKFDVFTCKKAVQYWDHGGAEIGIYYVKDTENYDYVSFRLTNEREEGIGFIDYDKNGKVADTWIFG